jgi:hypothetical protein
MVAVKGDGVMGATPGNLHKQTGRPFITPFLGLGLVEFSHEPRLAGGAYGHYITSVF